MQFVFGSAAADKQFANDFLLYCVLPSLGLWLIGWGVTKLRRHFAHKRVQAMMNRHIYQREVR